MMSHHSDNQCVWMTRIKDTGYSNGSMDQVMMDKIDYYDLRCAKLVSCWFNANLVTRGHFDCQTFSALLKTLCAYGVHCDFVQRDVLVACIQYS